MDADDWARVRAVRLRALREDPDAFGTVLSEDLARPPHAWRERLMQDTAASFVATREGNDIGLVTGAPYAETAGLFGMWVDPSARGLGAGRALVGAVVAWARGQGHVRIRLDVADTNAAAIRLYEGCGFKRTGAF